MNDGDDEINWPQLPVRGYLRGSAATVDDVDRGDAVFSQASSDSAKSKPLAIALPQYALWRNDDGVAVPVFVVQAEKHVNDPHGDAIFGLRTLGGDTIVASAAEVVLLGQQASKP